LARVGVLEFVDEHERELRAQGVDQRGGDRGILECGEHGVDEVVEIAHVRIALDGLVFATRIGAQGVQQVRSTPSLAQTNAWMASPMASCGAIACLVGGQHFTMPAGVSDARSSCGCGAASDCAANHCQIARTAKLPCPS
jgi:hypothetical protein